MTRSKHTLAFVLAVALAACGGGGGNSGDDTPGDDDAGTDGDGGVIDADIHPDGEVPPGCVPNSTECNNCVDDDMDGNIDGNDIECSGAIDDDEGSFATGIPGDNMDVVNQDCFFDGDSGGGNDGCNRHVCCMLGLTTEQCAEREFDNNYDPVGDCPAQSQECIDNCGDLTPPGCDCFGCCTLCDDEGCVDIYVNPTIAPDCDETTIHDPVACPTCTPSTECGSDCPIDTTDCILCPGEDESGLDPSCTSTECPDGETVCEGNTDCPEGQFCSAGCCIFVVD